MKSLLILFLASALLLASCAPGLSLARRYEVGDNTIRHNGVLVHYDTRILKLNEVRYYRNGKLVVLITRRGVSKATSILTD